MLKNECIESLLVNIYALKLYLTNYKIGFECNLLLSKSILLSKVIVLPPLSIKLGPNEKDYNIVFYYVVYVTSNQNSEQ